jgi:putative ABC transport system permease protein
VTGPDDSVDVLLDVIDLEGSAWVPTLTAGESVTDRPGLVLSRKAADDLGVEAGDTVSFRHPLREGLGYRWVDSDVLVAGIHPHPYRFVAYLDQRHATMFDLEGIVNLVDVVPERGLEPDELRRPLFELDGVGSVVPVATSIEVVRDTIGRFVDVLSIVQWAVLLLAVLIAFNSSAIGADERAREHATMFAFGLPPRTVLGLTIAESAIVGLLATAIGVVAGRGLVAWLVGVLVPDTMPDIAVVADVGASTYVTAVLLGVVAVALAPVLTARKLARMDIPATLRVVE